MRGSASPTPTSMMSIIGIEAAGFSLEDSFRWESCAPETAAVEVQRKRSTLARFLLSQATRPAASVCRDRSGTRTGRFDLVARGPRILIDRPMPRTKPNSCSERNDGKANPHLCSSDAGRPCCPGARGCSQPGEDDEAPTSEKGTHLVLVDTRLTSGYGWVRLRDSDRQHAGECQHLSRHGWRNVHGVDRPGAG